jgi:hypothetical protein
VTGSMMRFRSGSSVASRSLSRLGPPPSRRRDIPQKTKKCPIYRFFGSSAARPNTEPRSHLFPPCPSRQDGCVLRSPCRVVQAPPNPIRKGRMRPVARSGYETVPDRIEMDVLHVRAEIPIVPDQVFAIAALPDRLLTSCAATRIAARQAVIGRVRPGERLLDLPPARWSGKTTCASTTKGRFF